MSAPFRKWDEKTWRNLSRQNVIPNLTKSYYMNLNHLIEVIKAYISYFYVLSSG